jgi:hypothetical protein
MCAEEHCLGVGPAIRGTMLSANNAEFRGRTRGPSVTPLLTPRPSPPAAQVACGHELTGQLVGTSDFSAQLLDGRGRFILGLVAAGGDRRHEHQPRPDTAHLN